MRRRETSPCKIINSQRPDYSLKAASVIRAGGIVAIPTETFYGLAVDPCNGEALERLFAVKKRVRSKPVLVLVDSVENLGLIVEKIPAPYHSLIRKFWPGPLTLIFPARQGLPELLTGSDNSVGVRLSSHRVATEISRCSGGAITATSANISNESPAKKAQDIVNKLGAGIDLIVDNGKSGATTGSTIVREHRGELHLVREGLIGFDTISQSI
jgi:L-threonylcarbamoyladenylate synthase